MKHIFAKYCTPSPSTVLLPTKTLLEPPSGAYLNNEALDKWATDTNGSPFSEETKQELKDMLDVNDDGNLTFATLIPYCPDDELTSRQVQRLLTNIPAADGE